LGEEPFRADLVATRRVAEGGRGSNIVEVEDFWAMARAARRPAYLLSCAIKIIHIY
jgi:hypothetical protein